jgi:hypothetical protein
VIDNLEASFFCEKYRSKLYIYIVDEVYDHTRPSTVIYMSSMQVYVEYMIILILYIV